MAAIPAAERQRFLSACANSARIRIPKGNSPMTATIHESPAQVKQAPAAIAVSGLVDLADGHAFVRISGYRRGPDDIYVSAAQIRQYGLRQGDLIEGTARPQANSTARGKFRPLLAVDMVNSRPP